MTKKPLKNIHASVFAKLKNHAKQQGRDFNFLCNLYCQERFLYRLGISKYKENIILKGGLLLIGKKVPLERPTKDIDLLGLGFPTNIPRLVEVIRGICDLDAGDGVRFDTGGVHGEGIIKDGGYPGIRIKFNAYIGTARFPMQVDFSFGDNVIPNPIDFEYPAMLDFPHPTIRAYSFESVVSEKFEAMCSLGIINSRMKDFYDIYILSLNHQFDGKTLKKAISETFKVRGTELKLDNPVLNGSLAEDHEMQIRWAAFVNRVGLESGPSEFKSVIRYLVAFLEPVVESIVDERPFSASWEPGVGDWR